MPGAPSSSKKTSANTSMELNGARYLDFTQRPLVMGIINCTPDSFFPGSRTTEIATGVQQAESMISEGADILDIGGESSRPGSDYVDADAEIARIVPLIEEIRGFSTIPISVDTRKADVAKAAVAAGADLVNDISGLSDDPDLVDFAVQEGLPVIIMHMRGTPKTMQKNPSYGDAVAEIIGDIEALTGKAMEAGILRNKIIVDPGIGFGKRLEDNIDIIGHADGFQSLGFPLLFGASRKSFIGTITNREVQDRLAGSLAVAAILALSGADIIRVHDVKETMDVVRMVQAVTAERN